MQKGSAGVAGIVVAIGLTVDFWRTGSCVAASSSVDGKRGSPVAGWYSPLLDTSLAFHAEVFRRPSGIVALQIQ
jgi:hypothetical protein